MDMQERVYMGVDPGKKGGVAVLSEEGEVLSVSHLGDELLGNCRQLFTVEGKAVTAFVEKQSIRPGQSGGNALMTGYGIILGALAMAGADVHPVSCFQWRRLVFTRVPKGRAALKHAAVSMVSEMFPKVSVRSHRGAILDGLAEALLIAEACRRSKS